MHIGMDIPLPALNLRRWWDDHTDNNWAFIGEPYDPFYGIKRHLKDFLKIECMWERHTGILKTWNRVAEYTSAGQPGYYVIFECPRCHARMDVHFSTGYPEMVPERVKEDRRAHFKSLIQPYRNGQLSREYVEAYGTKGIRATKDEVRRSKYVWQDIPGWHHREKAQ